MKRELRKQFTKTRKTLKPNGNVKESFSEILALMEMVIEHLDEKVSKPKKEKNEDIIKDRSKPKSRVKR